MYLETQTLVPDAGLVQQTAIPGTGIETDEHGPAAAVQRAPDAEMAADAIVPEEPEPLAESAAQQVEPIASRDIASPNYGYPVHVACEWFPLMSDADLERLADDIKDRGLMSPIVLHDGQLVDGRNRLLACRLAEVEPTFVEWSTVYTGSMPITRWIWSVNAQRRHLTGDQMAALVVKLRAYEARESARQRQVAGAPAQAHDRGDSHGGPEHGKSAGEDGADLLTESSEGDSVDGPASLRANQAPAPKAPGTVRAILANEAGVSEHKMQQALNVEAADPAALNDVAQGDKTLLEAVREVKAKSGAAKTAPGKRSEGAAKTAPGKRSKAPAFDLERDLKAAMKGVDAVLDRAPEARHHEFLQALMDTLQKMM